MDIQRYRQDHSWIFRQFHLLHELSRKGVVEHAGEISKLVLETSARIKLHLAAEEATVYPALARSHDPTVAALGKRYQAEMQGIAKTFVGFVRHWSVASRVTEDPDGFREAANTVLKTVFERMKRENMELYPAVEKI